MEGIKPITYGTALSMRRHSALFHYSTISLQWEANASCLHTDEHPRIFPSNHLLCQAERNLKFSSGTCVPSGSMFVPNTFRKDRSTLQMLTQAENVALGVGAPEWPAGDRGVAASVLRCGPSRFHLQQRCRAAAGCRPYARHSNGKWSDGGQVQTLGRRRLASLLSENAIAALRRSPL